MKMHIVSSTADSMAMSGRRLPSQAIKKATDLNMMLYEADQLRHVILAADTAMGDLTDGWVIDGKRNHELDHIATLLRVALELAERHADEGRDH